jgi:hypothetical protein
MLSLLLSVIASVGCEKVTPADLASPSPIATDDPEYILVIMLDLSGSFARLADEKDGRAYRFTTGAVDKFFRQRLGNNDRVIIGQLSATTKSLLFDGSPRALRQRFPSAKEFGQFMRSQSNHGGSRIHLGISEALDYLMDFPGVATGKTKTALFVLSDLEDNFPDSDKTRGNVMQSLATYTRMGGIAGFYYVSMQYLSLWRKEIRDAKIRNVVLEPEISDPKLPTFD